MVRVSSSPERSVSRSTRRSRSGAEIASSWSPGGELDEAAGLHLPVDPYDDPLALHVDRELGDLPSFVALPDRALARERSRALSGALRRVIASAHGVPVDLALLVGALVGDDAGLGDGRLAPEGEVRAGYRRDEEERRSPHGTTLKQRVLILRTPF